MPLLSQCFKALLSLFQDPWHVDGTRSEESGKQRLLAFRQTLEAQIRFRGAILCLVAGAFAGSALYVDLHQELIEEFPEQGQGFEANDELCTDYGYPPARPYTWQLDDPRSFYFISLLLVVCTGGVFLACAVFVRHRLQRFTSWESAICIVICVWIFVLPAAVSRQFAVHIGINFVGGRWSHARPFSPSVSEMMEVNCVFASWIDNHVAGNCKTVVIFLDALITVTCIYLPLRSISRFAICFSAIMCPVAMYAAGVTDVMGMYHSWTALYLLAWFAFIGPADKMSHRWQTWVSRLDLGESIARQEASEKIARCLCDVVVSLTSDLQLCGCSQGLKSFLPHSVDGSLFTDYLSAPDVPRFNAMMDGVSHSELPGCMSVSLLQRGISPREANLVVVSSKGSHGSYLLGIAFPKEGLPPEAEDVALMPSPETIGALDDRYCSDSNSGQTDSILNQTLATSEMFTLQNSRNVASIIKLGLSEHWILETEHLKVNSCDILGKGGYGIVYGGSYCGSQVAVKCQQHSLNDENRLRHFRSFANEIRILRRLRHPNIVLFHGACLDSEGVFSLILERVLGQCLWSFVEGRNLSVDYQLSIGSGITSALWYLHAFSPCVVHGDLTPNNIMIEIKLPGVGSQLTSCAKLIDFGLSRVLSGHVKALGGTKNWQAPEIYMCGGTPKPSVDVFSFGCVLFFIMTGHKPFDNLEHTLNSGCLPPLPWPSPSLHLNELESLCERCVRLDAEARPSIESVWTRVQDIGDQLSKLDTAGTLRMSM